MGWIEWVFSGIGVTILAAVFPWLWRRFRGQQQNTTSGDHISVDIGDNSKNVAVGKNITQTVTVSPPIIHKPYPLPSKDEARSRLAQLQTDSPETDQPLPDGSFMPHFKNSRFVGRAKEMRSIMNALHGDIRDQVQTVALTGQPGLGKTQLAIAFAYHYGYYFAGGVYWIHMNGADGVATEIARSAERGMPGLPSGCI